MRMRLIGRALGMVWSTAALAAAQPPIDPLRQHFEAAQTFQLTGELDRAATEYTEEVIPRALLRLGNLAYAEGKLDEASALFEEALTVNPGSLDAKADLASMHFQQRSLERARELVREILQRNPEQPRALAVQGKLDLLEGRTAPAIESLRRSIKGRPDRDAAFALSLGLLREKKEDQARVLFDEMVARGSTSDLHLRIARTYLETGFVEEAIAQLKTAVERDPAGRQAQSLLARLQRGEQLAAAGASESILFDQPRAPDVTRSRQVRRQLVGVLSTAYYNLGVIQTRTERQGAAADNIRHADRWKAALDRETDEPSAASTNAAGASSTLDPSVIDGLIERGALDEAEGALWPMLEKQPSSAELTARLGAVRARQRRSTEAEALLRRAIAVDGQLIYAYVELAALYRVTGRHDKAKDILAGGLKILPADPRLISAVAALQEAAGEPQRALETIETIPESTRPPEAVPVLVEANLELGRTDEALRLLEAERNRVAESPDLLILSARAYREKGDRTSAERNYEQALALSPESVEALRGMASLLRERGEEGRAVDLLVRARRASGDSPDVLRELAPAAARAVRLDEALDAARRLVAIAPNDPLAAYLLGTIELQTEDWAAAQATFQTLIERDPGNALGHLGLGIARFGRRSYDKARAEFEQAAKLNPKETEALYHLGLIAREQAQNTQAISWFEQVLTVEPTHVPALTELGATLMQERDYRRAQIELERAVKLEPDRPEPHYQLGLLYARLKDAARARREMQLFQDIRRRSTLPASPP